MKSKPIKPILIALAVLFTAMAGCGGGENETVVQQVFVSSPAEIQSEDASQLCDQADALLSDYLNDHQQRTQAEFLYNKVLQLTGETSPADRKLKARAHLGMGLISFFDLFDVLPTLLGMLGMNLTDLIGGIGLAVSPMTSPMQVASLQSPMVDSISSALTCDGAVNFGDYLPSLDLLLTNMLKPAADHFSKALEYNPDVSLLINNGWLVLALDNPQTPENEGMALDLSGEWDGSDIGAFGGLVNIILGALKLVASYDGLLQGIINPAFNPSCNPAPGSPEWEAVFGPYGVLNADGGMERMLAARQAFIDGFASMSYSFDYLCWESDDQSDDIIGYMDCGTDALCPGMSGYTAPDPDGTEGNGRYDQGEVWGMAELGPLLGGLLGGLLPIPLDKLSTLINPPTMSAFMSAMSYSVETETPVDLVKILYPALAAILGPLPPEDIYNFGLPAINLGAPFNPPWSSIAVLNPLGDGPCGLGVQPETVDETHDWPDCSRTDPANGVIDPAYQFYPDLDEFGNTVGVFGGLIDQATVEGTDPDGNLIINYTPMTNPIFNVLMTTLGGFLNP